MSELARTRWCKTHKTEYGDHHDGLLLDDCAVVDVVVTLACDECGGSGQIQVEVTRTGSDHAYGCDGGERCGETCPVPVPIQDFEIEPCPSCPEAPF